MLVLSQANQEGMLLLVAYTTVFQYLFFLREISHLLSPLGTQAVVYLAAAVSDFYIHPANMVGQIEASARRDEHRSLSVCNRLSVSCCRLSW